MAVYATLLICPTSFLASRMILLRKWNEEEKTTLKTMFFSVPRTSCLFLLWHNMADYDHDPLQFLWSKNIKFCETDVATQQHCQFENDHTEMLSFVFGTTLQCSWKYEFSFRIIALFNKYSICSWEMNFNERQSIVHILIIPSIQERMQSRDPPWTSILLQILYGTTDVHILTENFLKILFVFVYDS